MDRSAGMATDGEMIFLSRNSKLARWFQEIPAQPGIGNRNPRPQNRPQNRSVPVPVGRPASAACPRLQAIQNPSMELSRPVVSALMRDGSSLRCRQRGVLLDNEYVRDVCASGCHQHCPFISD